MWQDCQAKSRLKEGPPSDLGTGQIFFFPELILQRGNCVLHTSSGCAGADLPQGHRDAETGSLKGDSELLRVIRPETHGWAALDELRDGCLQKLGQGRSTLSCMCGGPNTN